MYNQGETIRSWAEDNFGAAHLSDERRVDRVVTIGEAMASNPGKTIPQMFASSYEVKAAYNLFKQEEATPENLQAGHREKVCLAMTEAGVYLLVEDTTAMSWSGKEPITGLGPIGGATTGLQGFFLHSVLAMRWQLESFNKENLKRPPIEILGISHQKFFVRKSKSETAQKKTGFKPKQRARESQRWEDSVRELGESAAGVRYVHIADREADIYEYLFACQQQGHGYVVRAAQNRALANAATGGREGRLFEKARETPESGSFKLKLRSRKGFGGRTAELKLSYCRVLLSSPKSSQEDEPIECSVIRVWEENVPAGIEPLEWILLSDCQGGVFERALECVLQYVTRWVIEEFHKALKTGLKAESLQLEHVNRLFAAVAIKSIVALRLIDLKERVRIDEGKPAEESSLSDLELKVLQTTTGKPLKTVKDVALQIGRLGGHMNRKADGMPGWITLWRGMEKLRLLVEGVRIAHNLKKFG